MCAFRGACVSRLGGVRNPLVAFSALRHSPLIHLCTRARQSQWDIFVELDYMDQKGGDGVTVGPGMVPYKPRSIP